MPNNMKDSDLIIEEIIVIESADRPLQVDAPIILYLSPYPELLGFYTSLAFFGRKPFCRFMNQKKLSEFMGIDYVTFIKRRNKLRDLGVLNFKTSHGNQVKLMLYGVRPSPDYYRAMEIFNKGGIEKINSDGIEKINTPSNKEYAELLDFSRKSIRPAMKENMGPLFDTDNIYIKYINILNKYNINNNNLINITNKLNTIAKDNNLTPKKLLPKKEEKTFAVADYDKVLKAYMRYKGVMLKGPELQGARKIIKLMFLAERTPDQIISFMRWAYQNIDDDDNGFWLKKWTLWTIQKKISEYMAGKFGKKLVDEFEIYAPPKKN